MSDDLIPAVFLPLVLISCLFAFCYLFIDDFSIFSFLQSFDFNFIKFEVF